MAAVPALALLDDCITLRRHVRQAGDLLASGVAMVVGLGLAIRRVESGLGSDCNSYQNFED
jgi:hypothetical protein